MNDTIRNIERWAEDRNLIEGSRPARQLNKLAEEMNELVTGVAKYDYENQYDDGEPDYMLPEIADAIGDMAVVLTIIARQLGLKFEDCVAGAYDEIKDRKGKMVGGIFQKDAP